MNVIKFPNAALNEPAEKWVGGDSAEVSKILAEALLENDGVVLAANQLGMDYRVIAILSEQIIVMFNPIIVDYSDNKSYLVEGCLSSPNLFLNIKRPSEIRVRYTEPNGEVVTRKFAGISSHMIQNAIDRLDGIDFSMRANRYHLERGKKNQKTLRLTPREMIQQFVKA